MGAGGIDIEPERPAHVKKIAYFKKLITYFNEYPNCLIVKADHVGSAHMSELRVKLRKMKGVVLMGKNTQIRKAMRLHCATNPKIEQLLWYIRGNIGFIFCKGSLTEVAELVEGTRRPAPAKPGVIAPCNVTVPAGNTGLEPTQTAFLQALNIASKISKGQIEILKDVPLIKKGDKVGSSEAALLEKLKITPFSYGLEIQAVYENGDVYDAEVLKLKPEDICGFFVKGVANVAAVSLAANFPTTASVPHLIVNGYKRTAAVSLATDYTFTQIEKLKTLLSDPAAMAKLAAAAAAAAAAAPAAGGAAKAAAKAPEPEPEPEPEDEADFGGLFD